MAAKKTSKKPKGTPGGKKPGPRGSRNRSKRLETGSFDRFIADKYEVDIKGIPPLARGSKDKDHRAHIVGASKRTADKALGRSNPNRKFKKAPPKKKKK
jgi:hypothetical protein